MLTLVTYPNDVLREKAKDVVSAEFGTAYLKDIVRNMMYVMITSKGIGLAANQVGLLKRVIVISTREFMGAMVNPKLLDTSKNLVPMSEGCLSFPGQFINVTRPNEITVQYQDIDGTVRNNTFSGVTAKCIQHEIDHLNGIVFLDHKEGESNDR